MLKQHEPHPAIVMDRYWNVLKTNDASPRFFGSFVNLSKGPKPRNLLDLMFDPDGMRPFIENWDEVASGLLQRVYREAIGHVTDTTTIALLNHLRKYPGVKGLSVPPEEPRPGLADHVCSRRRENFVLLDDSDGGLTARHHGAGVPDRVHVSNRIAR